MRVPMEYKISQMIANLATTLTIKTLVNSLGFYKVNIVRVNDQPYRADIYFILKMLF